MAARRIGVVNNGLDVGQQREVDPRAEILSSAGEQDDANFALGVGPLEGLAQFVPHSVVHGVGTIGTAQPDLGDMRVVRLGTVQHDLDSVQFGNGHGEESPKKPFHLSGFVSAMAMMKCETIRAPKRPNSSAEPCTN